MKPIKIHSFKDAIFFPFRLVYNLDIWWKAVLGLGIVLILAGIQLSIFGKDDKPSAETVAAVNDGREWSMIISTVSACIGAIPCVCWPVRVISCGQRRLTGNIGGLSATV